jgi:PKD repeat protein
VWDVEFTDTSTGEITSWSWDLDDGATSALQNPTNLYSGPGAWTVTLTVTGPGGTDTDTQIVDMSI